MLINRILAIAVVAGLLAGACVSVIHLAWTAPLIQAAEAYEEAAAGPIGRALPVLRGTGGGSAHGDDNAWMPADGIERSFRTVVTNLILGVGAAFVIAGLFALKRRVDVNTGLAWGAGAFLAVGAAPALGLPPELPGMSAADLATRQVWWIGCAGATGAGLALLAYGRATWVRAVAVALIVVPHAVGAPQPPDHTTAVPDGLLTEFTAAALLASAAFWLTLGAGCGALASRWLKAGDTAPAAAAAIEP